MAAASGSTYIGRFAPTPSGPLHAGSLVAALASWLDARAHGGQWLLRFEDLDGPRTPAGAAELIGRQLAQMGLLPDAPPLWQSARAGHYAAALQRLRAAGLAYPCGCTRREIDEELAALGVAAQAGAERVYPGSCRAGLQGRPARAWRLRCGDASAPLTIAWQDRRLGAQQQDVTREVGDFVLQRADGPWAYQLAVVVDDAAQGVSDVVRGEDLAGNTARQIQLQRVLGLATPAYLHTPLVLDAQGRKLSKSKGAPPLDLRNPVAVLAEAGRVLGLDLPAQGTRDDWLGRAVVAWRARWGPV